MNRATTSDLPRIIAVCLRIVATRESPEALPYSRTLLHIAVLAAFAFGVINRIVIPGVTWPHALLNSLGEISLLLVGLHLVLTARALPERFHKVATAMLCISALGGGLLLVIGRLPDSLIVSSFITVTYLGQLSGALTSLRHGLDTTWWPAGLYLFAYLWVTLVFFNISASLLQVDALHSAVDFEPPVSAIPDDRRILAL